MADTSQSEPVSAAQTNGIENGGGPGGAADEDERGKMRPADIDADMREMERRKRVELIMNSRLFREELERIIETQMKDGGAGTTGLLQQISEMMGMPKHSANNMFKSSNCVVPINDIRGVESMGYAKGEKILRCKLASVYRLMDLYGWAQGVGNQITARLNQDQEHFLVNPYGMLYHELTASSLVKIDMQGNVVEQGTSNFGVNIASFSLHAAIHAARPDIKCIIHVHTPSVLAISALKCGLLPISQESVVIGEVSTHPYAGGLAEPEEREKVARNLGPMNKILILTNHGAVCCGETIEEAFFNVYNTIMACETQLKLMPMGIDNLVLVSDETRKQMYEAARRAPDGTGKIDQHPSILADKRERKWRIGGMEFEALMRMLDNAGFRTGYIYRHPLVKGEPPRPRNDVEVPPAVSSLGYLLEEEEMYKQGIWKPGRGKGNDRTRWLNSPNVYQKVEILETGTPDPKKITKWVDSNADEWVADGSPTHSSTPMKIDVALQFVPKNTNPKEFKLLQQQIKDNRRADKISAGPQSHILEGVTWEEARKMQDAGVTQTSDQVVVVGAASKGIIQRGFQHHAMVYKAPYSKNPFDSVTDEELDEYKKVIEKKVKGEYDTDFSESEGLSSTQISKQADEHNLRSPTSATSETEEESRDEPRVLRIETKQAPKPSQPEVVLSDDDELNANMSMLMAERNQAMPILAKQNSRGTVKLQENLGKELQRGQYYRTYSHSGFPRGSYFVPNPVHFHIVRSTHVQPRLRPLLVTLNTHTTKPNSIGNNFTQSLNINLPLQTIKDFMEPFASVLQLRKEKQSEHKSSQTSNVEYSGSDLDSVDDSYRQHFSDDLSDDDKSILSRQHAIIMRDINTNCELLDLDTSFSDIESVETDVQVAQFKRRMSEDTFQLSMSTFENATAKNDLLKCIDQNNDEQTLTPTRDNDTNDVFYLNEEMLNDEQNYNTNNNTNNNEAIFTNKNIDIDLDGRVTLRDSEMTQRTVKDDIDFWPDKHCSVAVKLVARGIYKYVMSVCIETIESVEFPEIRCYHDAIDVFDMLISFFDQYSECFPNESDRHFMKQCVVNTVMKHLETHFFIIPATECNGTINTSLGKHKIAALKRFVSIIVYILFDKINNPDFQCAHDDTDFADMQFHSTLESCDLYYTLSESSSEGKDDHQTTQSEYACCKSDEKLNSKDSLYSIYEAVDAPKTDDNTITTFLSQKSDKSGSMKYWFMINDKVSPQTRSASVSAYNDERCESEKLRRMSAPARISIDHPKSLSPIMEESRRNLFMEFSYADEDESCADDQDSDSNDELNGQKIIFRNDITFLRNENIHSDYSKRRAYSSVTFVRCNKGSKRSLDSEMSGKTYDLVESDDSVGDWMGYELAKF